MSDVSIRIRATGIRLEFHGSEALYERLLEPLTAPLAAGNGAVPGPTRRRSGGGGLARESTPAHPTEAKEAPTRGYEPPSDRFGTFRRQIDLSKDGEADRVAAFAFYLWNYEKKETFREEEVEGCFHAQGIALPADAAAVYGELLSRRLLAPGAAERSWRLTGKGRDHVRHHLLSA